MRLRLCAMRLRLCAREEKRDAEPEGWPMRARKQKQKVTSNYHMFITRPGLFFFDLFTSYNDEHENDGRRKIGLLYYSN
jgi:hypothetical protein